MESIVNAIGILYGIALIFVSVIRSRTLEPMRLDVLFMPKADETTRPVNLVAGLLVSGYGIYSLWLK